MTPADLFDRRLETGLDDVAQPSFPDYFDDILAVTGRTRQRPAWVFPERWIPMVDFARQPAQAPALPWRMLAIAAALVLALTLAMAALIGSRPRIPAPFGPAANGELAYISGGFLHMTDDGSTRLVAAGTNSMPRFAHDGRRIAFLTTTDAQLGKATLVVVDVDGGTPRTLLPEPLAGIKALTWSPDGRFIALELGEAPGVGSHPSQIRVVQSDGGGVLTLDPGMPAGEVAFRPPDGAELVFRGWKDGRAALYLIRPDGTGLRPLGPATTSPDDDLGMAAWSPDGRHVAYVYGRVDASGAEQARVRLIEADGSDDRMLGTSFAAEIHEYQPTWSPDGKRIALHRWRLVPEGDPGSGSVERGVTIVTLSDPTASVDAELPHEEGADFGWNLSWAPDGSAVVAERTSLSTVYTIDPDTGEVTPFAFQSDELPTWQRLPVP